MPLILQQSTQPLEADDWMLRMSWRVLRGEWKGGRDQWKGTGNGKDGIMVRVEPADYGGGKEDYVTK